MEKVEEHWRAIRKNHNQQIFYLVFDFQEIYNNYYKKESQYMVNGIILEQDHERASVVYAVHDGEDHERKMLPMYVRFIRSNKKGDVINNITIYDY